MNIQKLAVLIFVSLLSAPLMADTIYTYTGNPFAGVGAGAEAPYVSTDFVSITFTLTNPLPANLVIDNTKSSNVTPISYSFSDGVQTLDTGNSLDSFFNIGTDGSGHIINWELDVFVVGEMEEIGSENEPGEVWDLGKVPKFEPFLDIDDIGTNINNPEPGHQALHPRLQPLPYLSSPLSRSSAPASSAWRVLRVAGSLPSRCSTT
jgi:hypothetical protein